MSTAVWACLRVTHYYIITLPQIFKPPRPAWDVTREGLAVHLDSTVSHAVCDFGPGTRGNKGTNKAQTHTHGKVGRGLSHLAAACLLGTVQSLMEASR